ncbi:MAG: winged helix-turn-helix transcriptional regulator [Acetobacteraceae bacterium]|nr:winged helix-turn-helix transcriptional regulator [Acetobacteraceae bacterium]
MCHKVRTAARLITNSYDETLRPVGLRATQLAVLIAIGTDGAMSITALAQLLGMDRTTLSRNLGPLEKEGLVAIGVEGWRRSRTLEITNKGRARVQQAFPLWKRAQDALREKLGDRNWNGIRNDLDRLIRAG